MSFNPTFNSEGDRIYAVMVTGKDPARKEMALGAIRSFLDQSYGNRFLLIIDDSDDPVRLLPEYSDRVLLLQPNKGLSLGELRNVAVDYLPENAIWVQWDDDDWHVKDYIKQQYIDLVDRNLDGCSPHSQVKYFIDRNSLWIHTLPEGTPGFAGAIMVRNKKSIRYPSLPRHEDSVFWSNYIHSYNVDCWENPSHYYIRVIHQRNTSTHLQATKGESDIWLLEKSIESNVLETLQELGVSDNVIKRRVCRYQLPIVSM